MKKVIYKKNFKEAYRFNEKSKIQQDIIDTLLSFQQLQNFSPNTIEIAYLSYTIINRLSGKPKPIPIYQFVSDMSYGEALNTKTWVEIFYNSALFDLLSIYKEYPRISDFAKMALEDDKLKYSFMKFVYNKKPKNIQIIANYVDEVV